MTNSMKGRPPLRDRPTAEEVALLPPFEGLAPSQISLIRTDAEAEQAWQRIEAEGVVGFDTESKPTFTAGAEQTGPHVIQFAVADRAYVVQVDADPPMDFLRRVIESPVILKVGFGLKSDDGPLRRKLGLALAGAVDLSTTLRVLRYKQALGVKAAVAIVLGRRLSKSKKAQTSNWAMPRLTEAQLVYAANDAYAALRVYRALDVAS